MSRRLGRHRRAVGTLALIGCQLGRADTAAERSPAQQPETIALPAPRQDGGLPLDAALHRRRSAREFTGTALTPAEIGQLLWAAQGVTNAEGFRTAPSAGALYPLELYVVTSSGAFHYEPAAHRLRRRATGDLRRELSSAALGQASVREAPMVVVIAAVYERTARKYGADRARRYAALEAGHAAQNLLLEAVSLGLGAVPVGAFDDARVAKLLRLDEGEAPLYLVPVGHPRS